MFSQQTVIFSFFHSPPRFFSEIGSLFLFSTPCNNKGRFSPFFFFFLSLAEYGHQTFSFFFGCPPPPPFSGGGPFFRHFRAYFPLFSCVPGFVFLRRSLLAPIVCKLRTRRDQTPPFSLPFEGFRRHPSWSIGVFFFANKKRQPHSFLSVNGYSPPPFSFSL